VAGMSRELSGMAHKIILTRADNPRAARPAELAEAFNSVSKGRIIMTTGIKKAKTIALKSAGTRDLILVTGSLFVVGEFRYACRKP